MSGSGNTTVPSPTDDTAPPRAGVRSVFGYVRIWSRHQPRTIGEFAPLDPEIRREWIMGCDEGLAGDGASRIRFFRQRPGRLLPGSPITGHSISREQTRSVVMPVGIELHNTGKEQVFVNGTPLLAGHPALLFPGDIVLFRRHSAYLVVRRPIEMAPVPAHVLGSHDFGEPDADRIVGESPGAWAMRLALANAGETNKHAFLYGQSGSGKELAAAAIHRHSGRTGEYVAANAAAIPESILELELFGCAKDYPNPRSPERLGYIGRTERGGTFFLDEFGQLSEDGQARMLRAMQGESVRLGTYKPYRIDVLVIGATNKIGYGVKHDVLKRFPHVITIPSLRERLEDVPLIARDLVRREARENPAIASRFLRRDPDGYEHVAFSAGFVQTLLKLPLDGNVRDVHNLLVVAMQETKAAAEARGDMEGPLTIELPADMSRWQASARPVLQEPAKPKADASEVDDLLAGYDDDRRSVIAALERHGWHIERTAKALGLTREALRYRMKKLRIERPRGD